MDKQDNSLVNKFLKQISKIIDHKLEKLTTVESAIVDQVNIDGSVNLHIPPDNTIFTGIQNQSIYQNLKVGDCVKVLKQNNKASNMWIIGGHNLKGNDTIEKINKTVSNITDFIIEQDTSGIWTYRKWNSGIAECWGKYNFSNITTSSTWSGYNYVFLDGVNYPTSLFIETPTLNLTSKITNFPGHVFIGENNSAIETGSMGLSCHDSRTISGSIQFHAIGRWK